MSKMKSSRFSSSVSSQVASVGTTYGQSPAFVPLPLAPAPELAPALPPRPASPAAPLVPRALPAAPDALAPAELSRPLDPDPVDVPVDPPVPPASVPAPPPVPPLIIAPTSAGLMSVMPCFEAPPQPL